MDTVLERQTELAKRAFGYGAMVTGSAGSRRYPGVLTMAVDGQPIGSGQTLERAMHDATRRTGRSWRALECAGK